MHIEVMRSALSSLSPLYCAIDGPREGLSGPGLYFEDIWKVNERRFIKQQTLLDLDSKRVQVALWTELQEQAVPHDIRRDFMIKAWEGALDRRVVQHRLRK